MHHNPVEHRPDLYRIATQAMLDRGLAPEFPAAALEAAALDRSGEPPGAGADDLCALPWCSIDSDDSRHLEQLSCCESKSGGSMLLRVAVADVDAWVKKGSAIDAHATHNCTTVRTAARVFTMLPERLCSDLTSFGEGQPRLALVTEMVVDAEGSITLAGLRHAWVRSRARLACDGVAAWLEGRRPMPPAAAAQPLVAEQLILQDTLAQTLRVRRQARGMLAFASAQAHAVFEGERLVDLRQHVHHRARQLTEELTIATNECGAQFLADHQVASLRRVVRAPGRWQALAAEARKYSHILPAHPDSTALAAFLARRRRVDPVRFPDLSLVIAKLMGAGEYVVSDGVAAGEGHFSPASPAQAHATAPNHRLSDLITARQLKALLTGQAPPYPRAELDRLAAHCSAQQGAARKVERMLRKCEAALWMQSRIGQRFDAIVVGQSERNTWVRVFTPPVEGRLGSYIGAPRRELAIGERLRVRLVSTDAERGFIDFAPLS